MHIFSYFSATVSGFEIRIIIFDNWYKLFHDLADNRSRSLGYDLLSINVTVTAHLTYARKDFIKHPAFKPFCCGELTVYDQAIKSPSGM